MPLTIGPIQPPAVRLDYSSVDQCLRLYNLPHTLYGAVLYYFHQWRRTFGDQACTDVVTYGGSPDALIAKIDGVNGTNCFLVFHVPREPLFVMCLLNAYFFALGQQAGGEDLMRDIAQAFTQLGQLPEPEPVPTPDPYYSVVDRALYLASLLEELLDDPIGVTMLREQGHLLLRDD